MSFVPIATPRPPLAVARAPLRLVAPRPHALIQVAVVLGCSASAGLLIARTDGPRLSLAVIAALALAAFGFARPAAFVVAFLLARPALDHFGGQQFGPGLDPAGGLGLLLMAILLVTLTARRRVLVPPASGPLAGVLLVSAMAAGYALVQLRGVIGSEPVSELARLTALLAVYVLAANFFAGEDATRRLWRVVALSAVGPALYGLWQWVGGVEDAAGLGFGRIDSTFVGPNPFGAYLAVTALLLVSAPLGLSLRVRLVATALVLTALVGTFSREGWFLFLGGLVLLEWRRRPLWLAALAVALATVVVSVPVVKDRVLPPEVPAGQTATSTYESFGWRVDTWRILLAEVEQSPVIGFGLRSTPYVNPRRSPALDAVAGGYAAHNMVVRWLVEGGVVLLVAFVLLFAALLREAARAARGAAALRRYGRVLVVLWTGVVVVGLSTDDPTSNTALMYALLALAGSVAGNRRLAAPSKRAVHEPVHGCAPASSS